MTIDAVSSVVLGVEYGLVSTEAKRLEDSVRAGENNYLTAMFQIWQGSKAVDFANKVSEAAGFPLLSGAGKSIVYLTPIVLAVLKSTDMVSEEIRPVLTFIQNHLSTLYQIAAVISAISLLFLGSPFFAISSLLILGIGIMDQNGWLPVEVRQFLHQYSQPLLIVTALISGGIFDQIFAVLNILSWCANAYLSQENALAEDFAFQENLTRRQAIDFLNGQINVEINPRFIRYNPVPPIPNIDIEFFMERFNEINWEQNLPTLRKKLRDDARFIARHPNPDLKNDQEIIAIARHSLRTFIDEVKEQRILQGEPADYEKLHNYLKIIAKYLEGQNNGIIQTDIILRLLVEGGEYCGPGKFEVAESVFAETIGGNPDIPFRDKIAYCLQDERNLWMQKFYSMVFTQNAEIAQLGQIIDWQDIHNYNCFVNLYGDEFGLRKAAADNDDTALIDPFVKLFISYILKDTLQKLFWDDHSLNHHTQILVDSIGTPKLPKPDVYAFWQNWIERQQINEPDKTKLREELAEGRLYNRPLEINGKFTRTFAALMLLDMDIVEIRPRDLPAPHPLPLDYVPIRV